MSYTPQSLVASMCICMFRGYLCYMGNIPLMLGVGVVPHMLRVWGHLHICQALVPGSTSIGCPLCFILDLFVVHYVLHIYHSYNYYSSSYGGVFWSVIYFISDHGPFLDGASCNIRSSWSGSATNPDARMPWRCYFPCLHATAATSIFDASSGLCQLCYGFSTQVGFFFRVEFPTILYIICLVSVLLSGARLDAVFPYGGSTVRVCTIATLWSLPMSGICATWWWSLVHTWYA